MTRRSPVVYLGLVVVASCAIDGPQPGPLDPELVPSDQGYPPIDGNEKYFKPGPPIATEDAAERASLLAYHQQVIDAHHFSYVIAENEATARPLTHLAGFAQPEDTGDK